MSYIYGIENDWFCRNWGKNNCYDKLKRKGGNGGKTENGQQAHCYNFEV